jgi:hypothetical protein
VEGEDWSYGERDSPALNVVALIIVALIVGALIVGALGLGLVCSCMAVSVRGLGVACRRGGCRFLVSPFELKAREIKFGDLTARGDLIFEPSGSGLNMDAGLLLFD